MIYIYELIDPRDNKPFYGGQSKNPEQRFKTHISTRKVIFPRHAGLTATQQRINVICDLGLLPTFNVVETCSTFAEARIAENSLITKLLNEGHNITNTARVIGDPGKAKQHTKINDMIADMGYMTTIEAAHYLNLTPTRVRMLVCEDKLHIKKLGGMNLYSLDELKSYNENKISGGRRKSS